MTPTPTICAALYDFLAETPPFSRWNLPPSDDVQFVVRRSKDIYGHYEGKPHRIVISSRRITSTACLVETMAHEMIHLHIGHAGMRDTSDHGPAFERFAAQVCAAHGFNPDYF